MVCQLDTSEKFKVTLAGIASFASPIVAIDLVFGGRFAGAVMNCSLF